MTQTEAKDRVPLRLFPQQTVHRATQTEIKDKQAMDRVAPHSEILGVSTGLLTVFALAASAKLWVFSLPVLLVLDMADELSSSGAQSPRTVGLSRFPPKVVDARIILLRLPSHVFYSLQVALHCLQ